ncbi:MAG TPA: TetR/AcrR family transcriptional regulator [Mycobacteriales bacterium]|jgi:AcrR family transcriptional regulator|nr:TetR/AcrR family transcriptional regulator [Mycobacteriales bacterium]
MTDTINADETRNAAKARLIAAAIQVFHDKGYEQCSVQDVADAAGIVKGTLYYHVRSKEELLYEIMEQVLKSLAPRLEALADGPGTAMEKLREFVHIYVAHTVDNTEIMQIFFRDYDSLSDSRKHQLADTRDVYDSLLRSLLRQGQRDGEIRADLDVELADLALFGMLNWMARWYRRDGRLAPDDIAESLSDLAVAAVTR